jgi:hypothetical protein
MKNKEYLQLFERTLVDGSCLKSSGGIISIITAACSGVSIGNIT